MNILRGLILGIGFLICLTTVNAYATTNDWIAASAGNWSDSANWSLGHKPATGEDVTMGGTSDQDCTVDENTANLNSIDMTGYSGIFSANNSKVISVIATSGTQVAKFTNDSHNVATLNLGASSGASLQIYSNGLSTSVGIYINQYAGQVGSVYLMDNLTFDAARSLIFNYGTFHTDGATDSAGLTHNWGKFSSSSSNTRSLYLGNSQITITGTGACWSFVYSNYTLQSNTATITFTGAAPDMYFGSSGSYYSVVVNGFTSTPIFRSGSFGSLSITGPASTAGVISVMDNLTVTTALTLTGNSALNRILFASDAKGTPRTLTLTGATTSVNNVDFQDITFARTDSGGLDLTNGGANIVGDAQGNTRTGGDGTVTFTTGVDLHWKNVNGGTWSTAANWDTNPTGTSRVPLPQDNVFFDLAFGTSKNVSGDVPRLGKTIDWRGATYTTGLSVKFETVNTSVFGGWYFIPGMTISNMNKSIYFEGRGTYHLTSSGKTWNANGAAFTMLMYGGKLILDDNFSAQTDQSMIIKGGEFDAATNNVNVTTWGLSRSGSTSTTAIDFGTGTWTLNGTGTIVSFATTTGLTLNQPGGGNYSNIVISNTSSTDKTIAGGNLTYDNISITGGGTGKVIFTGSNSWNNFTINAPKTVQLTSTTTQTIRGTFSATGTSSNHIIINAVTPASAGAFSKSSGIVDADYLELTDITGTGGATWYAGANSTASNSAGWILSAPVGEVAAGLMFGGD